jgi:hypothetical protein
LCPPPFSVVHFHDLFERARVLEGLASSRRAPSRASSSRSMRSSGRLLVGDYTQHAAFLPRRRWRAGDLPYGCGWKVRRVLMLEVLESIHRFGYSSAQSAERLAHPALAKGVLALLSDNHRAVDAPVTLLLTLRWTLRRRGPRHHATGGSVLVRRGSGRERGKPCRMGNIGSIIRSLTRRSLGL